MPRSTFGILWPGFGLHFSTARRPRRAHTHTSHPMHEFLSFTIIIVVIMAGFFVLGGRHTFKRPSPILAPSIETSAELIAAFEQLHQEYFSAMRVEIHPATRTISLFAPWQNPAFMVIVALMISGGMLMAGFIDKKIEVDPTYLLFCLVPAALVLGWVWASSHKQTVIDLSQGYVVAQGKLLRRSLRFDAIVDIYTVKTLNINMGMVTYSVELRTRQGRANMILFETGIKKDAALALADWCRRAMLGRSSLR